MNHPRLSVCIAPKLADHPALLSSNSAALRNCASAAVPCVHTIPCVADLCSPSAGAQLKKAVELLQGMADAARVCCHPGSPPWVIISHHHSSSLIISHHHSPSVIISHHHSPSLTITHHHSPSATITHPQPPSLTLSHPHSPSVVFKLRTLISRCASAGVSARLLGLESRSRASRALLPLPPGKTCMACMAWKACVAWKACMACKA